MSTGRGRKCVHVDRVDRDHLITIDSERSEGSVDDVGRSCFAQQLARFASELDGPDVAIPARPGRMMPPWVNGDSPAL